MQGQILNPTKKYFIVECRRPRKKRRTEEYHVTAVDRLDAIATVIGENMSQNMQFHHMREVIEVESFPNSYRVDDLTSIDCRDMEDA